MNDVPPPQRPSEAAGCIAFLLIVVGVVLLFPGACAIYAMSVGLNMGSLGRELLTAGLCGVIAIVFGISLLGRRS